MLFTEKMFPFLNCFPSSGQGKIIVYFRFRCPVRVPEVFFVDLISRLWQMRSTRFSFTFRILYFPQVPFPGKQRPNTLSLIQSCPVIHHALVNTQLFRSCI